MMIWEDTYYLSVIASLLLRISCMHMPASQTQNRRHEQANQRKNSVVFLTMNVSQMITAIQQILDRSNARHNSTESTRYRQESPIVFSSPRKLIPTQQLCIIEFHLRPYLETKSSAAGAKASTFGALILLTAQYLDPKLHHRGKKEDVTVMFPNCRKEEDPAERTDETPGLTISLALAAHMNRSKYQYS